MEAICEKYIKYFEEVYQQCLKDFEQLFQSFEEQNVYKQKMGEKICKKKWNDFIKIRQDYIQNHEKIKPLICNKEEIIKIANEKIKTLNCINDKIDFAIYFQHYKIYTCYKYNCGKYIKVRYDDVPSEVNSQIRNNQWQLIQSAKYWLSQSETRKGYLKLVKKYKFPERNQALLFLIYNYENIDQKILEAQQDYAIVQVVAIQKQNLNLTFPGYFKKGKQIKYDSQNWAV